MNEYVKLIVNHLLSWPVVVLVIVVILQKQIRELISEFTAFVRRASHMSVKRGDTTLQAGVADASSQTKKLESEAEFGTGSAISLNKAAISDDLAHERQTTLDHGKGIASVLYREESIRAELVRLNFPLNEDETADLLVRHLAAAQCAAHFERVYRMIYGSQLSALDFLNTNGPASASIVDIFFFDDAKAQETEFYGSTTFEQWLGFLIAQGLVAQEDDTVGISVQGRDFLVWIVTAGLPRTKAH